MPQNDPVPVIADKQAEQEQEDKLVQEAEENAAAAPKVEREIRKQQAGKAAGRRIRTEAETRYLIDEQLRKVGWEAGSLRRSLLSGSMRSR